MQRSGLASYCEPASTLSIFTSWCGYHCSFWDRFRRLGYLLNTTGDRRGLRCWGRNLTLRGLWLRLFFISWFTRFHEVDIKLQIIMLFTHSRHLVILQQTGVHVQLLLLQWKLQGRYNVAIPTWQKILMCHACSVHLLQPQYQLIHAHRWGSTICSVHHNYTSWTILCHHSVWTRNT